ncbi:MAG TPA: alginate lyase family protein, partial [Firmicutes bacterium]|nr:alginate lyase family protein [Bacillota bacterium]
VSLEWSIPTVFQDTGVTYRIYRSALKDFSTAIFPAVAIIDDTRYLDRDVRAGQTFYYRIIPVHKDGTYGRESEEVHATVASVRPISAPKTFYADWQTGQAHLEWDLGDSRARQIRIERCVNNNDKTTCTLLTLLPGWVKSFQDNRITTPEGVSYKLTVVGPEGGQSVPQVAVLSGYIPRVEPIVQFGQHPALFISQPEIDAFLAQAKNDVLINQIIQLQIVSPARLAAVMLNSKDELTLPAKNDNSAHDALAKQAREAALGYAFTGDAAMAQAARKVLLTYARELKNYPLLIAYDGRFHKQTLEESIWLLQMAWAYDLIYNSEVLSAVDRQIIENDLLKEMIKTIDRYDKGLSNWQALHNAGIGAAAFVLGDQKWVEEVLTGSQGFTLHIGEGLRDDGIWWEQAIGYHNYTVTALAYLAEMAYRYGYDLYHLEVRDKTLQAAFDGAIHHAFRSGLHPVVGNTSVTSALSFNWTYGLAAKHYQEDAYAVLARRRSGGGGILPTLLYVPQMSQLNNLGNINIGTGPFAPGGLAIGGSSLLLDTGMTVLRSPQGAGGPDIAMLFKPHGIKTGHQAADNLTIMLAADAGHWLSGPGSYSYDAAEQGTWYKQTVARNGVVVDQRSQYPQDVGVGIFVSDSNRPSSGELLHAVALPGLGYALAATDTAYSGVRMERLTLLHTPYVIDRYAVTSAKQHTYDYVLNISGQAGEVSVPQEPRTGALGSMAGYQHIKNLMVGQTAAAWHAGWTKGKANLQLRMLGEENTQVISATGLGPNLSAQPMLLVRRQVADTVFLAVLETYMEEPVVRHIEPLSAPGVSGMAIHRDTGAAGVVIDRFAWVDGGAASLTEPVVFESGEQFQADWAFFRPAISDQAAGLLLQNGTYAGMTGLTVSLDAPADIALEYDGRANVTLVYSGGGTREIRLQPADSLVAEEWRLYKALPTTDLTEEMPEIVPMPFSDAGVGVWYAEPNTIYLLSTETPDEAWLRQLVTALF